MRLPQLRTVLFALTGLWLACGAGIGYVLWQQNQHDGRMLMPRETAPGFALADQVGRVHSLDDYDKRAVALAFVPDASTLTRQELRSLNAELIRFDKLGVKVFGVAPVDQATAKELHDTEKLEFPILTDIGNAVGKRYGVIPGRAHLSYVIGPKKQVLLPVGVMEPGEHGKQLVELAECCFDTIPTTGSPVLNKPIAPFTLPRADTGEPLSVGGASTDKATVILFLSARCPCSGRYDTRNRELAKLYGARGVRFVAVYSSADEPAAEVAAHAKKAAFPFPALHDADHAIADRFDAQVTPEVYVLDKAGVVRYHGRVDDTRDEAAVVSHDLRNALDFLLAGRNPTKPETRPFGCAIARSASSEERVVTVTPRR